MKNLLKELLDADCLITEEQLYEMARVQEANSGIPVHIYVSTKNVVHGAHGPRIKISNIPNTFSSHNNFVVSISKEPSIKAGKERCSKFQLEDIFDWVKLNYVPLMKYWNNEYRNDAQFFAEIKKIWLLPMIMENKMSNSRSKQQCKIKREIRQRKLEIDPQSTIIMGQCSSDDKILTKLFDEFWSDSIRHGCNRGYYAKKKVDQRKSERMNQKEEDRKEQLVWYAMHIAFLS